MDYHLDYHGKSERMKSPLLALIGFFLQIDTSRKRLKGDVKVVVFYPIA